VSIEVLGLRDLAGSAGPATALDFLKPVIWHIGPDATPWWKSQAGNPEAIPRGTPTAEELWNWALYDPETDAALNLHPEKSYFGEADAIRRRRSA
jgi:hypothetical protein